MRIEVGTEVDGRFITKVTTVPEAMIYGTMEKEEVRKVEVRVLRILADRIES